MLVKVYLADDEKPIYYHGIKEVMSGYHHIRLIDGNDEEIIIRNAETNYDFITVSMEE